MGEHFLIFSMCLVIVYLVLDTVRTILLRVYC